MKQAESVIPMLHAQWPAPPGVRVVVTLRGSGDGHFDRWNFACHVGDEPSRVAANRAQLRAQLGLPREPAWLEQVHGTVVVDAVGVDTPIPADGSVARGPGAVCVVMTADCLPIALCAADGSRVAMLHAGWRGLVAGVVEAGVGRIGMDPQTLIAWMGPAIGQDAFEVGPEVRDAFMRVDEGAVVAFRPSSRAGHWLADLGALVRQRLVALGVPAGAIHGGDGGCTFSEPRCYFSYRRDRQTGRMAALAWIED